jgi:hypothetical protein
MKRIDFLKSSIGLFSMTTLGSFKNIADNLREQDEMMPALFIGHGSPMNAIEDNEFTKGWKNIVKTIPLPKAILCISAHWETEGTYVTAMENPKRYMILVVSRKHYLMHNILRLVQNGWQKKRKKSLRPHTFTPQMVGA